MVKKNEPEITPIDVVAKPLSDNTRLNEIALSVGVTPSDDSIAVIEAIVAKFEEIDEKLQPLASQIENDPRVEQLIRLLSKGVVLEDAVAEVSSLLCDETNPKFRNAVEEAESFCEIHQMEHTDIECFIQYIEEILSKIANGEVTKEIFETLWKSFVYEEEIDKAFEAGVIRGRNMQIEELRAEREQGDGLGVITSGGTIETKPEKLGYIEQIIKNRR